MDDLDIMVPDQHKRELGEPPDLCERKFELERAEINMETGAFPMVLATEGEASDGDILSIPGAVFAERAPLQLSHSMSPQATLGSITGFRRDLQSTPRKLKATGQIELTGPGQGAQLRADIAHMILQGHLHAVSVRWEPMKWKRRTALPQDHPAFINEETEKDPRKRYGLYFDQWRVLEGSIVAVPADQQAIIGRADETTGQVSEFWRMLAGKLAEPISSNALDQFKITLRKALESGVGIEVLSQVIEEARKPAIEGEVLTILRRLDQRLLALEQGEHGRESNGEPSAPVSARSLVDSFLAKQRRATEDVRDSFRKLIQERMGRLD